VSADAAVVTIEETVIFVCEACHQVTSVSWVVIVSLLLSVVMAIGYYQIHGAISSFYGLFFVVAENLEMNLDQTLSVYASVSYLVTSPPPMPVSSGEIWSGAYVLVIGARHQGEHQSVS
jgi:hypothetical protein